MCVRMTAGYSFMNGCIYLILCLSGIFPIVVSLFPKVTIGPIIFIFGMMICEECTKHIPQRHHCAIFFGLFFSISDYLCVCTCALMTILCCDSLTIPTD